MIDNNSNGDFRSCFWSRKLSIEIDLRGFFFLNNCNNFQLLLFLQIFFRIFFAQLFFFFLFTRIDMCACTFRLLLWHTFSTLRKNIFHSLLFSVFIHQTTLQFSFLFRFVSCTNHKIALNTRSSKFKLIVVEIFKAWSFVGVVSLVERMS